MKRLFIILLVLLTAAAAVGCEAPTDTEAQQADVTRLPLDKLDFTPNPRDYGELDRDDLHAAPQIDPMYLPDFSEVVKSMNGGSQRGSYYLVATDAEELQKLTGSLNGRTENAFDAATFQKDFVVAVFVTVATGGFTVELESAYNDGNTVTVKVKVTPPTADFVTEALETHCVLIAFDRGDYYEDLSYDITVNDSPVVSGFAEA